MSTQFSKRSNDAYVATAGRDYSWTTVSDKFIIYDGDDDQTGKHYAYDPDNSSKYMYYDTSGNITSYGYKKEEFYSISQSGTDLTLN